MIERADTDNDGLVSEEEFYNIITKKTFAAWWFIIRSSYIVYLVSNNKNKSMHRPLEIRKSA